MPDSRSHSARAAAKATLIAQLPPGIRSRQIDNGNGLNMHILEAGYESSGRECVLLLHGFPELAYTWRKVMLPLAEAGYQVVAPDQRGYGMTTMQGTEPMRRTRRHRPCSRNRASTAQDTSGSRDAAR